MRAGGHEIVAFLSVCLFAYVCVSLALSQPRASSVMPSCPGMSQENRMKAQQTQAAATPEESDEQKAEVRGRCRRAFYAHAHAHEGVCTPQTRELKCVLCVKLCPPACLSVSFPRVFRIAMCGCADARGMRAGGIREVPSS